MAWIFPFSAAVIRKGRYAAQEVAAERLSRHWLEMSLVVSWSVFAEYHLDQADRCCCRAAGRTHGVHHRRHAALWAGFINS